MTDKSDDALFKSAPALSSDIVLFVERVSRVWRTVKHDENWKQEAQRALMKHLPKLAASDMDAAFSLLTEQHPMTARDGGPANPPGFSEMAGCLLTAARRRADAGPRKEVPTGPRRLHGRPCPKCAGPRDFLPSEGMIYCHPCNTAIPHTPGDHLDFADPPPLSDEEIQYHKDKVMRMAGMMASRSEEIKEGDDGAS